SSPADGGGEGCGYDGQRIQGGNFLRRESSLEDAHFVDGPLPIDRRIVDLLFNAETQGKRVIYRTTVSSDVARAVQGRQAVDIEDPIDGAVKNNPDQVPLA